MGNQCNNGISAVFTEIYDNDSCTVNTSSAPYPKLPRKGYPKNYFSPFIDKYRTIFCLQKFEK